MNTSFRFVDVSPVQDAEKGGARLRERIRQQSGEIAGLENKNSLLKQQFSAERTKLVYEIKRLRSLVAKLEDSINDPDKVAVCHECGCGVDIDEAHTSHEGHDICEDCCESGAGECGGGK